MSQSSDEMGVDFIMGVLGTTSRIANQSRFFGHVFLQLVRFWVDYGLPVTNLERLLDERLRYMAAPLASFVLRFV